VYYVFYLWLAYARRLYGGWSTLFTNIMSGVPPVNSSALANDVRAIFEKLTYGPAPEADNVAQVFVVLNCHFSFGRFSRIFIPPFIPTHLYTLRSHVLSSVQEAKYLGITLKDELSWSSHVRFFFFDIFKRPPSAKFTSW